jgi:peptidoglycan/xylan/chitin deacetylase (PgdA/CDA1 family)
MLQRSTRAGFFVALAFLALVVPRAASADGPVDDAPGDGYRVVGLDGGVFAFGTAGFHGSTGALRLNQPIVGMAATPTGNGYWLVAADGGIFSFGDAAFHGSTGALRLNQPIVGMAATPTGNGYWLVALDGGIFAFGDAPFHGSAVGSAREPVVGLAVTETGQGYRVVTLGGNVSGFGDAAIVAGAAPTGGVPIVGIATTRTGFGYWLLALDGTVTAHGDAPALGAAPNGGRQRPAVGIAGPGSGSSGFAYSLFRSRLPGGFASAGTWPGARQVALTFDDGPNPVFTPEVLDILARENVPATFFALGWAAERYPALARRAVDEGHSVQNHTWAHETLTRLDRAAAAANLARTSGAVERATGVRPTCYRPPSMLTNAGVRAAAASVGLTEVTANGANGDWTAIGPERMVANAIANADGRPLVLLMHDGGGSPPTRRATVQTLPGVIAALRARGYEFVRLC